MRGRDARTGLPSAGLEPGGGNNPSLMLLAVVGVLAMVAVIGMVSMDEGHSADAAGEFDSPVTVAPGVGTTFSYGDLTYEFITETELEVTGYTTEPEDNLIIPSTVLYSGSEYSVISIGEYAFDLCESLISVDIPDSVTSIGVAAFSDCTNLSSAPLPDSITSIGAWAFVYTGLTSVTIPNGVTSIEEAVFGGCHALASVSIPDSVTYIGYQAFAECSFESIVIPSSVSSIDDSAFWMSAITTVIFKSSTSPVFGPSSFETGTTINVYTPGWDPVEALDDVTSSITNIVWANPPQIGDIAFTYDGIEYTFYADGTELYISGYEGTPTEVVIPDTIPYGEGTYKVTSMEVYVFTGCTTLTSITLPDGIESIGTEAFSGCTNLSSITLPDGIASIGDRAFEGCSALTSVDLPDNVIMIGQTAFAGTGLTSVTIPSKVTEIGGGAFFACTGLNTVIFETESVPTLGNNVFETTTTINVYTPGWDPVAALADAHSSATTVVWANPPYPDLIFLSDPSDGTLTFGHFVYFYDDGVLLHTVFVAHGNEIEDFDLPGTGQGHAGATGWGVFAQTWHLEDDSESPVLELDGLAITQDYRLYHFGEFIEDDPSGGGTIVPEL